MPFPHPYLEIWIECRRYANPVTGTPALPEPEKGPLDQDADLMLAFDVLEEFMRRRQDEDERRRKVQEQARQMGFSL